MYFNLIIDKYFSDSIKRKLAIMWGFDLPSVLFFRLTYRAQLTFKLRKVRIIFDSEMLRGRGRKLLMHYSYINQRHMTPNIRSYCNLNCACLNKNNKNKLNNLTLRLEDAFSLFIFGNSEKCS